MSVIEAVNLTKNFRVSAKDPGLAGTLRHFFRRRYRDIAAVRDVSFAIEAGEFVGFLGPNGAGKTTTLKMLTGLIYVSSGTARVAGFTPSRREHDFLRRITLVMGQKQQLIWDLPALDSLKINAAVYGLDDATFKNRLGELSEMLELKDQLTQPVRKLSLGERMKAELLAALLHRPDVLFLDEPTLGLDVNAQVSVRNFLRLYNQQYQATVLLTSHYMADITALCRRVLLIHEGSLMYDGSLDSIRERFSPYREVKLELRYDTPREQLEQFGDVQDFDGHRVSLIVQRDGLTATVSRLLHELEINDLTVTDPPVENVIGHLFRNGTGLSTAPGTTPETGTQ